MKKLPVLCPQLYDGTDMRVVGCSRCQNWNAKHQACEVNTGCEHLPLVRKKPPKCPIALQCQHQIQTSPGLCVVRARGMICESALAYGGDPNPSAHPQGFHAMTVVSPEEWAERTTCAK